MFKVVGFLALGAVLSVNSEKYSDDYELMNDAEDTYDYSGNDYGYDYSADEMNDYEMNSQENEEGTAEEDFDYGDDYDFSEFDALYAAQEGLSLENDNDIAFGSFARIGQFPYTVYLRITKRNGKSSVCSGSIIGPRTVLTAHHCLNDSPKRIVIEAGVTKGGSRVRTRQVRTFLRWTRPRQASSQRGLDVGFIYTNKPFIYNTAVNRIRLCGSQRSRYCGSRVLKPGKLLYASGFGLQGISKIGTLKYATMTAQSDRTCAAAHRGAGIASHHICTKGGSGNTCGGDSGGPLVIRRSRDGRYDIQVGANSWSRTKCTNKNGNWDIFFEISYGRSYWNKHVPKYYKTGVSWV